MRRSPLAALLRLLIIAGGATYANPFNEDSGSGGGGSGALIGGIWLELPRAHVALEGDLRGWVRGVEASSGLRLRLKRDDDDAVALLATMPLQLDTERRFTIPCGYFARGGTYYVELASEPIDNAAEAVDSLSVKVNDSSKEESTIVRDSVTELGDSVVRSWRFEVRWPSARLSVTPEQIQTYPERPVTAILEFPGAVCSPLESSADFWLELLYCGHASGGAILCDGRNASSHAHVLSSEQVHGFPGRRTMTLRCELFGQAGDYALTLRPAAAALPQDYAAVFIKADWSEQFVLNVHGGSVFPCAGGGVRALFQYPSCVLERADRVRVFGRSGERMRYVAERRVRRGQHTATFDCRLFSERYPEYCFVYVSQAVTGAVANVREDCLPTLPLSEGAAGGWGEWSEWSHCPDPAHCSTATRSRHRFCDNPPPAYGAKYCEGRAVEIAMCACVSVTAAWEAADAPAVVAEVGVGCRCGCVLHLAQHPRLLAGSTRACPGHSFWLLKAEAGMSVRLRVEAVRLPCATQTLRVRAGDSLAAPLVASWDGAPATARSVAVTASAQEDSDSSNGAVEVVAGRHILIDLRTDDVGGELCAGGFIAHAQQIDPIHNASAAWYSGGAGGGWTAWWSEAGAARAAALALAGAAAVAALMLAAHSAHRTRAYQRAADKDTLTDSDACSASLELVGATESGSRSTLFSEVAPLTMSARIGPVSLRRLLPARAKHRRLRESCLLEGEAQGLKESDTDADATSVASSATITPEDTCNSVSSAPPADATRARSPTPSPLRRSLTAADTHNLQVASPPPPSVASETATAELSTSMSSVSREGDSCSEKDRDSVAEKERDRSVTASSRTSSAATLTNGRYSPALNGVCAARVRNPKHSKESSNRRRMLRASELSLTSNAQEMEIDYYDYEVNNAGSVPGSYLGMDPAFLVWIPPLEEGDIIQEIDEKQAPLYEEILPKGLYPDPGSNTESPESDQPSTLKRGTDNRTGNNSPQLSALTLDKMNIIHPLNFSISDLQKDSPRLSRRNSYRNRNVPVAIPMKDLTLSNPHQSPAPVHKKLDKNDSEAANRLRKLSDMSDIKFADENSDSSNEIKFMDDDTPDSNKLSDKFDVRV